MISFLSLKDVTAQYGAEIKAYDKNKLSIFPFI